MDFTYENPGTSTYLCCELTGMEIDTMGLGMMTNNQISGFVPSIFTQMDGRKFMKYNVSSKVPMRQVFSGPVNRRRLLDVFAGIADALLVAEEYMLDTGSVVLDMDYIFVNISDGSTEVVYVPIIAESGGNAEAADFFRGILFSTRFNSSENCDYIAEIINFLNQAEAFSVRQFKELLEQLRKRVQPGTLGTAKGVKEPVYAQAEERIAREIEKKPVSVPEEAHRIHQAEPDRISGSDEIKIPGIPGKMDAAEQKSASEKEISLFYLLQHYNKANADAYKEQKEAKKQKSSEAAEKNSKEKKAAKERKKEEKKEGKKRKDKGSKKPADVQMGFAVPGQEKLPSASVAEAPKVSADPVRPVAPPFTPAASPQGQVQYSGAEDFGETEYYSPYEEGSGDTVLMGAEDGTQKMQAYLVRMKNNERIPLDREILRIGRSREFSDYAIPENKFIGHSHCHILVRDGEFYIVDDNSKNHTYLNGTMLRSNAEAKLSHGAIVSVADEEFEFRLF